MTEPVSLCPGPLWLFLPKSKSPRCLPHPFPYLPHLPKTTSEVHLASRCFQSARYLAHHSQSDCWVVSRRAKSKEEPRPLDHFPSPAAGWDGSLSARPAPAISRNRLKDQQPEPTRIPHQPYPAACRITLHSLPWWPAPLWPAWGGVQSGFRKHMWLLC